MKWQYNKEYRYMSNSFRICIETSYHVNEVKNVTFICEQYKDENNEWHNLTVHRFYTNLIGGYDTYDL